MSSLLRLSAANVSRFERDLSERLAEQMAMTAGHGAGRAERRSWERSIPVLAADLVEAGLGGVEMLLEFKLPLSSKRADVVLAGVSSSGEPTYVVVELKQWSEAHRFEDSDTLVSVSGYPRPVLHPIDQVMAYAQYLQDFAVVLEEHPDRISSVAYLHNATDFGVADLLDRPDAAGRIFTGQRRAAFGDYLRSVFVDESGAAAAELLLNTKMAPSKQLMALAAEEVQRREMFVLLDEQREAFEYVRHAVDVARRQNMKTAVVVAGGPGSGKSVIALSLMGQLAREGRTVVHATGSQSFTQTLRKVAATGSPRVRKTFQYFNSFMTAEPNELDVLILDEAHRIRETSANRYTRVALRTGRPQIDELLAAARTPVFLLDQNQVVRPGEMGTVADIRAAAAERGIDVLSVTLDDQFRCGGSLAYVAWVERLLGLRTGGPIGWVGDDDFSVSVMESPHELDAWRTSRETDGYGARLTAGFCWPWSDPRRDGTLVHDVAISDWSRPWNLKGDRSVGGAPPAPLWATDPAGAWQVGCVYTAQGFEYDFAGVIIGPDLVWRDGTWRVVRDANKDPALRSRSTLADTEFERLVRNVYKVLLTRGMQGVGIYSTDPPTNDFLRSLIR